MNAALGQNLRFSNFLLTFSTNVRPLNDAERTGLVDWLANKTDRMFNHWDVLNGTVLKPAGTDNRSYAMFPADHKIESVKSRISIEGGQGNEQVHAHILLEVAHRYVRQEDGAEGLGQDTARLNLGVHVNVRAVREYLNDRIYEMEIDDDRKPDKIYVNSKLLTKGTDNSNKWLTLQYINKQLDMHGRNLRQDEHDKADAELSHIRQRMLAAGPANNNRPPHLQPDFDEGVGGALDADSPFGNPNLGAPEAPAMIRTTRGAPAMIRTTLAPPSFVQTTAAKIAPPRATRGRKPQQFK